ncbi:adenosine deaminase [Virgibacillus phasianinus]|uniref:adenine deaminase n=1 Tax=Virgibacillus phasianinus TaxID=2017483 RepID=A0A220TZW8_9BACI|nr:adenine deaminase C-terminal domain-containing protein [Virgibacillus phasianinus]ASK61173.1 adenosine deaminase [Virgibacillus phasianinus]
MEENGYLWRNRELREHVAVIDGKVAPTKVLTNGIYLNVYTKQWLKANIWILKNRIVYVGDKLPEQTDGVEMIDCEGRYLVPGYIEPHAHPFQLYNPESLAKHAAKFGTTTLVNDNLMWLFLLDQKKAFSLLKEFTKLPISMYWWARFDSQTALQDDEELFNSETVLSWLENKAVVQGGELTAWPALLRGDDRLLYWMQEANCLGKPVEGHLPGASEGTLNKMKLLGVNADHESMTADEVRTRLRLGFQVGLRYSSIRPDLPEILEGLVAEGINTYENMTMNTDGSTPAFYEEGLMNVCIAIAIDKGVPLEDAYRMASYNVAKHFNFDDELGGIAPGKIAHINILEDKVNPDPVSVLANGQWITKDHACEPVNHQIDWQKHDIRPITFDWTLTESDLQFSIPIGLDMINDVIMKPYAIKTDVTLNQLPIMNNDAFLLLIDRNGKWRVNTTLRGFTKELGAIASTYSTTGDIVFIGKNKQDILLASARLHELGGGIVVAHDGEIIFELPLPLSGIMFDGKMDDLIAKEKELKLILKEHGYPYSDPVYSILFLSATHLPFIRVTQRGIVDVKKREVLFPAIMR